LVTDHFDGSGILQPEHKTMTEFEIWQMALVLTYGPLATLLLAMLISISILVSVLLMYFRTVRDMTSSSHRAPGHF
jgi:membrane-associated protease RseP (regulator of RpoE activity)